MSNDFSNNPFAALQDKVQPRRKKIAHSPKAQAKPAPKPMPQPMPQHTQDDELDDSQLFLQSVQNSKPSTKKSNRHTALSEHEDFAKLNPKNFSSKKKKSLPKSPTSASISQKVADDSPNQPLDDDQAFMKAMLEVAPISAKGRDIVPEVKPQEVSQALDQSYESLMESRVEFALALKGEYLEGHVLGLDEATMTMLRAGQLSPEAHLDLHGLNAMQAYQALIGFFRGAWYKSLRTVLVVPGRGKNSLGGYGVLRDKLQTWLTQEPLKRVVLAFCTARPVDGGPGSVYVLLRKYKKKGKIQWERLPSDPDLF